MEQPNLSSRIRELHTRVASMSVNLGLEIGGAGAPSTYDQENLIITSGDVSDADGFLALAAYAASGADCVYVMNFPAFFRPDWNIEDTGVGYQQLGPGLGYKYSARQYVEQMIKKSEEWAKDPKKSQYKSMCEEMTAYYKSIWIEKNIVKTLKQQYLQTVKHICQKIWDSCLPPTKNVSKPKLFFFEGGVNKCNAFALTAVSDELYMYQSVIKNWSLRFEDIGTLNWFSYTNISMDFNGSMSFLNAPMANIIDTLIHRKKLKSVFVMGGVVAGEKPKTIPLLPNVINRFSCSTMNQFYHPEKSVWFFNLLKARKENVQVFVVPNNTVDVFNSNTWFAEILTNAGIGNNLSAVSDVASAYYHPLWSKPKKPFDLYVALALCQFIKGTPVESKPATLYIDSVYGSTFVLEKNVGTDGVTRQRNHNDDTNMRDDWESLLVFHYDDAKMQESWDLKDDEYPRFEQEKLSLRSATSGISVLQYDNVKLVQFDVRTKADTRGTCYITVKPTPPPQ